MSVLQTEFEFTLPRGYVDEGGTLHRQGQMRMATALDEVAPLADARAHANEAYIAIILLSRVVSRLGGISPVPAAVIEGLFAADFTYLQELYLWLNDCVGAMETECPTCRTRFAVDPGGDDDR